MSWLLSCLLKWNRSCANSWLDLSLVRTCGNADITKARSSCSGFLKLSSVRSPVTLKGTPQAASLFIVLRFYFTPLKQVGNARHRHYVSSRKWMPPEARYLEEIIENFIARRRLPLFPLLPLTPLLPLGYVRTRRDFRFPAESRRCHFCGLWESDSTTAQSNQP